MTNFTVKTFHNAGNSIKITIPKEIVQLYKITKGDLIELDFIKNHREGKRE